LGLTALAPAAGVSTNQLYKQRYELGADLHLGPNVRFYGELYHGQQTGHNVGPTVPTNQRDRLGLVNGFGEVYGIIDEAKTGWRAIPNSNARGAGFYNDRALLTGARVVAATGAGFVTGQDQRHTFGLRIYGSLGPFDHDWQAAYQAGSFAGRTVSAFAFNTDT